MASRLISSCCLLRATAEEAALPRPSGLRPPHGGSAGGAPDSQMSPFVSRRRLHGQLSLTGHRNPTTDEPPIAGQGAGRFCPVSDGLHDPQGDVSGTPVPAYLDHASGAPLHPAATRRAAPGSRPRVRRPATTASARPRGPADAGQRPRRGRRVSRRAPRRGHLHSQRHARLPPRRARPAGRPGPPGRPAAGLCRRALGGAPRRRLARRAGAGRSGPSPSTASGVSARTRSPLRSPTHGEPAVVALQSANPEVGACQPVAEVAASHRRAALRRRLRIRRPPPAPRGLGSGGGLGAQVGWPGRASACCSCASRPGGATRSPATSASTNALSGSRTFLQRWPPPPRCGPPSTSRRGWRATQSALTAELADAARADPGHRGVPRPRGAAPPPGGLLLPLRRRRGAGHRARPAGLRRGQRFGLHGQHPRAQPRARRHGRPHARQRAGLARTARPTPPRCDRLARELPGVVARLRTEAGVPT